MYNTPYYKQICKEMEKLGKLKNTIFLGQQVYPQDFYGLLKKVPKQKRLELPVVEELQMGLSQGLALENYLPVSIYQRIDFLPRASDQIVNHLNLIKDLSRGRFNPKIIIITTIGSKKPLDTGLQHSKDLTKLFIEMCDFPVLNVKTVKEVKDAFKMAREKNNSIMIILWQDLWKEEENV
jgi:pyruvate/2-oxoglutarate/acetoin dehydrogenase E1 component